MKQAGAELCQAQLSYKLWLNLQSKLAVEVVIKVGVQLLFWVRGWRLNKTKLIQISTQLEVVVEDGKEKVLKINFHMWLGGGGRVAGKVENTAIAAFK